MDDPFPDELGTLLLRQHREGFYTGMFPVSSPALHKPRLSRETFWAMREERRAYKELLGSLLPDDRSREDIAAELGVDRKTISGMLNPDVSGFGNGFNLIRYLAIVGALPGAPPVAPPSRLAAIEAKLDEMDASIEDSLARLSGAIARLEDRLAGGGEERHEESP